MRRVDRSVDLPCGYVVVPGWEQSADLEDGLCKCAEVDYQRNTLACRECGTVYAVAEFKSFRSGWSRLSWTVCF